MAASVEEGECVGVIQKLMQNFGFITVLGQADRDRVFFHFSGLDESVTDLGEGDEVKFILAKNDHKHRPGKNNNQSDVMAEQIRVFPAGTLGLETLLPEVYEGEITQCLRQPFNSKEPTQDLEPTSGEVIVIKHIVCRTK